MPEITLPKLSLQGEDALYNFSLGKSFLEIAKEMSEGNLQNASSFFSKILAVFKNELFKGSKTLSLVLLTGVLFAVVNAFLSSFSKKSENAVSTAMSVMFIGLFASLFLEIIQMIRDLANDIVLLSNCAVPSLVTVTVSGGNIISGTLLGNIICISSNILALIIKSVVIPFSLYSLAQTFFSSISPIDILDISELFIGVSKWTLTVIITVYVGAVSLLKTLSSSVDSLSQKTLKLAVSNMIPIVGKSLSDAIETVKGSSAVIKNTLGTAFMGVGTAVFLSVAIKIGAILIAYRISFFLIKILGSKKITQICEKQVSVMTVLFSSVVSLGVLFLVGIASFIKL